MIERGILCILIGAAVLVSPRFLESPTWRETIGGAYLVGWFALVLGVALVVVDLVGRVRSGGRR